MNDIEVWMPGRGGGGETHSINADRLARARRLNIKYADSRRSGEIRPYAQQYRYRQSADSSAILENYQRADGSVVVPEILREYVGKT